MISGKVWPLPTNLSLFFKNCITFSGCFCLVRSKNHTASDSPILKVAKLTLKFAVSIAFWICYSQHNRRRV